MKTLSLVLLVFGMGILHGDPMAPKVGDDLGTVTTTTGTVYTGAKLQSINTDGITILDSDGGAKIAFEKLPAGLQKKFGYDPNKTVPYAEVEQYKRQIAQLQDENAELRTELNRYKTALTSVKAAPKIGIEAYHCYLFQTVVSLARTGTVASGPYKGMSIDQGSAYAQEKWGELSSDEKMAYEKMAQETGDPIARQDAIDAANPGPVNVRVLQGQGE